MLPNSTASSISTDHPIHAALLAIGASWRAKMGEQLVTTGAGGYLALWIVMPVFQLAIAGLVYRGVRPELVRYVVVGIAASTFIMNSQYYIGQLLDEERSRGTLLGLFLAPCPRLSWLTGFALGGLLETVLAAVATVIFGVLAFGVRFNPDVPAMFLTGLLFLCALWGLGFVLAAIGLVIKRSNDLSNLLSPIYFLLGGIYYPVALLPIWLRVPAEALPFGYGMQALASASIHHAGITSLGAQLLPLAGFAVALPFVGYLTFRWLERVVRVRGQLELY